MKLSRIGLGTSRDSSNLLGGWWCIGGLLWLGSNSVLFLKNVYRMGDSACVYIYIYNAYIQHVNANKQILLISIIENDMWVFVFVCNLLK